MSKKILHIARCDKFIPPFVLFIKENFNFHEHEFFIMGGASEVQLHHYKNVHLFKKIFLSKLKYYFQIFLLMNKTEKIIIHGLFDKKIIKILFFAPWLLKKCHWVIWGGDLYKYKINNLDWKWKLGEFFRRPVIKNMGYLITYIEGDIDLAKKWYGATGTYCECLAYTSNLYKDYNPIEENREVLNIQLGNSASPENHHLEALNKLLPYKAHNICIYVPLSYGSKKYAKEIIEKGTELFGNKIKFLTEMMPFDEYLIFLGAIDIAIFNHKRQQAMGNTISLLGLGKKVYLRKDTAQWNFFQKKNIATYDINEFSLLNDMDNEENVYKIKSYFSESNYIDQWFRIFK